MIVAQNVLETASRVDVDDELVGEQSDPEQGILLTHLVRADRQTRRRFRLRWQDAPPALAESIVQHHATSLGAFDFRLRNGANYRVVYAEAPSLAPRSALAVDVDVVLEQALDSD